MVRNPDAGESRSETQQAYHRASRRQVVGPMNGRDNPGNNDTARGERIRATLIDSHGTGHQTDSGRPQDHIT